MAKKKSAKAEASVEEKLRALYDLQLIDSMIDKIRTIRGELPLEVQDLEDEVAGLQTRMTKIEDELKALDESVSAKKQEIKDAGAEIKRLEAQQNKVRNNREFDAINKEIEYQNLEIQLCEKRIKEAKAKISDKKEVAEETKARMEERAADLDAKKGELSEIVGETQREEEILQKKSNDASAVVDERLLSAYTRIRNASKNGLAVVPIERGASAGSFIKIPPQRILDVASRKRIIVDEHSGRILVDAELASEETEKINTQLEKLLKAKAKAKAKK